MPLATINTTRQARHKGSGIRLRALITGMLVSSLAFPMQAMAVSEPNQAPPASSTEWDDAVAAGEAGLPWDDAISWRSEAMREHVAWVSETWEYIFDRTPVPGETAPTIDSANPLGDGSYELDSWSGDLAGIQLIMTPSPREMRF